MNIVNKLILIMTLVIVTSCDINSYFKIVGQVLDTFSSSSSDPAFNTKDKKRNIIDGEIEPSEPDETENNKTIAGIDSNNDGIRDDIERMINRKYPGIDNRSYNYRNAFKLVERAAQFALVNSDSKESSRELMRKYFYYNNCLVHLFCYSHDKFLKGCIGEKINVVDALKEARINSQARKERKKFINESLSGAMFISLDDSKKINACEFDIRSSL